MPVNSSRTRRERHSRYSPAPSKPVSPSEDVPGDTSIRVIPDATADFGNKLGRYNYQNFPPDSDVWRADDFLAIARAVVSDNDTRPPSLLKASQATSHFEKSPSELDGDKSVSGTAATAAPANPDATAAATTTTTQKASCGNPRDAIETKGDRKPDTKEGNEGDGDGKADDEGVSVDSDGDNKGGCVNKSDVITNTNANTDASAKGKTEGSADVAGNSDSTPSENGTANKTLDGDDNGKSRGESNAESIGTGNSDGDGKDDVDIGTGSNGAESGDNDDSNRDEENDKASAGDGGGDSDVVMGDGNSYEHDNSGSIKGDKRDSVDEADDSMNYKGVKRSVEEQLARKSVSDIEEVVDYFHNVFSKKAASFTPPCDVGTFLALLASEVSFMKVHAHERNLALCNLIKSRKERTNTEMLKEQLSRERGGMSRQIEREVRSRETALMQKPQIEGEYDALKIREEQEIEVTRGLRDKLELAQLNDLEGRRRLDRVRLKVAAIRGEMVIPTVDQIVVEAPPQHVIGDWDDEVEADSIGEDGSDTKHDGKDVDDAIEADHYPRSKRPRSLKGLDGIWRRPYLRGEDSPSPLLATVGTSSSDLAWPEETDTSMDTDEESTEFRLLKNRLAMVEQEAVEWSGTLQAERKHCQLLYHAKQQLEEELFQYRQNNGLKSTAVQTARLPPIGPRGSSKLDSKPAGTLRVAIRAAISNNTEAPKTAEKMIRKMRKSSKPSRALVMTNL